MSTMNRKKADFITWKTASWFDGCIKALNVEDFWGPCGRKILPLFLEMLWNARYRSWHSNLFTWLITAPSICPIPSILPCRLLSYLSIVSLLHCSPSYLRVPSLSICHLSLSLHLHVFQLLFLYPNLLYPIILQRVKPLSPTSVFSSHLSHSNLLSVKSLRICLFRRSCLGRRR